MTAKQLAKYKGEVVEVLWGDAHSVDPWVPLEELDADALVALPCSTFGIIIGTSEEGIMVAGSVNAAGSTGANWFLPRGMIKSITILK